MSIRTRTRPQPEPGPLSELVLKDIVRRVVEVAKPQRIVMFGSAARGKTRADSDVDLLVVKSGRFQRGRLVDAMQADLDVFDFRLEPAEIAWIEGWDTR